MPTLNWIQETGLDRYLETGSDNEEAIERSYPCRICGKIFTSLELRDRHELEHPVANPAIFIEGTEICVDHISITNPINPDGFLLKNVNKLSVNGEVCHTADDLFKMISKNKLAFLDVRYENDNIQRRLRIDICIADKEELKLADEYFLNFICDSGVNEKNIVAFTEKISNLKTVKKYCDGLVRYLQALMAKDGQSGSDSLDTFEVRFNQASQALKGYNTELARAVMSVINFNRNDFYAMEKTGIYLLDNVIDFFNGGSAIKPAVNEPGIGLPVDRATEFIVSDLFKDFFDKSIEGIECDIESFPKCYVSLQDKSKFEYICYRKSILDGEYCRIKKYENKLKYDDAFSVIVGGFNE